MSASSRSRWSILAAAPSRRSIRNRRRSFRQLFSELLEQRRLLTTVTSVEPAANSHTASIATDVAVTFDQDVVAGTATAANFVVHGSASHGQLTSANSSVTASGAMVTHNPAANFAAGEQVQVTATSRIATTGGAANRRVWQFRTASSGSGQYVDGGQLFGPTAAEHIRLGDVDQDGDLDAMLGGRTIWLNDGTGTFTDSGQVLGADLGESGAEFGDIDGDGDLDIVGGSRVHTNDGNGIFANTNQDLGGGSTSLGDVDGDGDLDVITGVAYAPNRLFFNNGGQFSDSGQSLGNGSTDGNTLADFDGDGDLDVLERLNGTPNRVWFNDGSGVLSDSGQALGGFRATKDADAGDVDGDGDLDLVMGNSYGGAARLYLNAGDGVFAEVQAMATANSPFVYGVKLIDLDGDADLDFVSFDRLTSIQVWSNDGGTFVDTGQRLTFTGTRTIWGSTIGDVDNDGDVDFIEVNRGASPGRIWFNQNLTPNVSLSVDNPTVPEAAGTATITATLSATHTNPVTIDLGVAGTATLSEDYTLSGAQIVIAAGETSGSIAIAAVQDTVDEPDETIVVDIVAVTEGQELGAQQVTVTIEDDDEPIPVPTVTLGVDSDSIAEDGGVATFTATLSTATTVPVTIDFTISGTAVASDFMVSANQLIVNPGETSGAITVTAVDDAEDESDETVVVEVASVSGGVVAGTQAATTTIVDDDDLPLTLVVTSLTPSDSGFELAFNGQLDQTTLNLYDTQNLSMGPADLIVTGATSGQVRGSLLTGDSSVTFVASGGPLASDLYTVSLRSADDGFRDIDGMLLDGNGDGVTGDDYLGSFAVADAPAGARTITIPDFVRGPGQSVNLPASSTIGIPISISDGENVRAADVRISYDPALLEITGASAPAGGSAILNTNTPGLAILVFFSSSSLPAGETTFINLEASVPADAASEIYGHQQLVDLHSVTVGDGNDNEFPVIVDDATHFATHFADVSGNGRINAADAAQLARFAALIDSGFTASLGADPVLLGDVSGNGRVNAADASLVAQFAALIDVPQIPPVPAGIAVAGLAQWGQPLAGTEAETEGVPLRDDAGETEEVRRGDATGAASQVDQVMEQLSGSDDGGADLSGESLEETLEAFFAAALR